MSWAAFGQRWGGNTGRTLRRGQRIIMDEPAVDCQDVPPIFSAEVEGARDEELAESDAVRSRRGTPRASTARPAPAPSLVKLGPPRRTPARRPPSARAPRRRRSGS